MFLLHISSDYKGVIEEAQLVHIDTNISTNTDCNSQNAELKRLHSPRNVPAVDKHAIR